MAKDQLTLAVDDLVDGVEVSPEHVSLSLLGDFQEEVAEFLRGSRREVDSSRVTVAIKPGSLAFSLSGLSHAKNLWDDLAAVENSIPLDLIDPVRAKILQRWQSNSRANPSRKYKLLIEGQKRFIVIDSKTVFHFDPSAWAAVEKYLVGKIMDMGGKTRPNIHLELESGKSVTISATREQLAASEENRLYRTVMAHVVAEENIETGQMRNLKLVEFRNYGPRYDEAELQSLINHGTKIWSSTADHNSWLDNLRGYDA